jgi:preprotein translocase subunit SecG
MLLNIVIALHLIACLLLILFVLLHAGRGGGLSEMFGGGVSGGGLSGSTVVEKNLDRMTIATAILFTITTFALVFRMEG